MPSSQTGQIVALFRPGAPGERMQPLAEATAIEDFGFEGDRKARPGSKRQVLLMDQETSEAFGLGPGDVDENIVTRGLRVNELQRGQHVTIGEVVLEVTIECAPCHKMDEIRPGLREAMRHQRGMLTRVLRGGKILAGDMIEAHDQPVLDREPAQEVAGDR